MLSWDLFNLEFTLIWDFIRILLFAVFLMVMFGVIEFLFCVVVLDGMIGTKYKANSELVG